MIRYGDEKWTELEFSGIRFEAERRDGQWVDVYLRVETAERTPLPTDLIDFSILAVCTHKGDPIQLATLDEDCDSEYQLTDAEKAQIEAYIRTEAVQKAIAVAAAGE